MAGRRWIAAGLFAGVLGAPAMAGSGSVESRQRHVAIRRSVLADVAQAALPSVVSITTVEPPGADHPMDPQRGIGSGFIVSADGEVLTSAHVIEDARDIRVTVLDPAGHPEEFPARVVGQDAQTDCALLRIQVPRRLPTLELGSATQARIADWVVVIGSPYGLSHTVSVGVVSFKGRTDVTPGGRTAYFDYLQTDAAINPGNSGGPVLDVTGKVIAIANAVNVAGQGIGFAVPAEIARAVLPELRAHGHVRRGWMGISVLDASPEIARDFGVARWAGVVVSDVVTGSPAQRAGLRKGDLITAVDADRVDAAQSLRWKVANSRFGHPVQLRLERHGRPLELAVMLDALPPLVTASAEATARATLPAALPPEHAAPGL